MPHCDHIRVLLVEGREGSAGAVESVLAAAGLAPERPPPAGAAVESPAVAVVRTETASEAAGLVAALRARAGAPLCLVVCPAPTSVEAMALMRAGTSDVVPDSDLAGVVPAVLRLIDQVAAVVSEVPPSSLDRLSGLMRAAGTLAMVIADRRGLITEWGEGAERLFGYRADEVVGLRDLTLGHDPAELEARARELGVPDGLAALLADGATSDGAQREWIHLRRDGTRFHASRAIAPIVGAGGGITGYAALGRDITTLRRNAEEQEALRRVATAVAAEEEPEVLFGRIAREAATITDGDCAGVSRYDVRSAVVLGSWSREGVRGLAVGAPSPVEGGAASAEVYRTGRGVRIDDVHLRLDDTTIADWGGVPGFRGVVASPVHVAGQLWGVLWVGAERPDAFGPDDEARLARFAELCGMAIAKAEARERIVSDTVAGMFRGDLDVSGTLDLIVSAARRALGADRATCYVTTEDGTSIESVHTTETDPRRRGFLDGACGRTREQMPIWHLLSDSPTRTMVIEDLESAEGLSHGAARALSAASVVGIRLEHPSITRDGVPGLLGALFLSYRRRRQFSVRERAAVESLAGMAAVALANARLHTETMRSAIEARAQTTTDPLTGLANHRAFQERLAHEVTRARRHGRSLSLALIDIDHFRGVNERHGHQMGDRVLAEIAGLLRAVARDADLVARVGGEEIAWLMPETDAMEAWQAVDRAREVVARTPMAGSAHVTVSAGVCDLAQAGSAADLVRLSEGALYWAKQHGRDVAFLYSPTVVEELSADERADRLARVQALQSIRVLARAVDAKDPLTLQHSERVADLAVSLGAELGWDADRLIRLREAGLVHDVGKIGVPDRILFKPARLSPEEYEEIKRHAAIGAAMVADVLTPEQVAWVRGHHERWDGGGYPDGLAGDVIPDGARVLALADSWDVMTSERSYHEPLSTEDALAECRRCAGAQFSVALVDAIDRLVAAHAIAAPPAP